MSGLGGILFFLTSKGYSLKRTSLLQRFSSFRENKNMSFTFFRCKQIKIVKSKTHISMQLQSSPLTESFISITLSVIRVGSVGRDVFQFVITVETKVSGSRWLRKHISYTFISFLLSTKSMVIPRLGHLLQMVQQTRETKNTGFISLYHKKFSAGQN